MLAAGVVEVLTRGKDLHRLRAGSTGKLQQAGMQTLIQKKVSGENTQHKPKTPEPKRESGPRVYSYISRTTYATR